MVNKHLNLNRRVLSKYKTNVWSLILTIIVKKHFQLKSRPSEEFIKICNLCTKLLSKIVEVEHFYTFVLVNPLCAHNNGLCSTFCFPTPSGRTCGCQDNVELLSDQKTCEGGKKQFCIFKLIWQRHVSRKQLNLFTRLLCFCQSLCVLLLWLVYNSWIVCHILDSHASSNAWKDLNVF